jgi:hypothetical protein
MSIILVTTISVSLRVVIIVIIVVITIYYFLGLKTIYDDMSTGGGPPAGSAEPAESKSPFP